MPLSTIQANTEFDSMIDDMAEDLARVPEPQEKSTTPGIHQAMPATEEKKSTRSATLAKMRKNRYKFLKPNAKRHGLSLMENEDISQGYVFCDLAEEYPTFYYWEDLVSAEAQIKSLKKPRFQSVMLRDRPLRCHVELDIEETLINTFKISEENEKKLKAMMRQLKLDRSSTIATNLLHDHVITAMKYAMEAYGLPEDEEVEFYIATDFKRDDGKRSMRAYTNWSVPNYAHYKNWRRIVKESLPEAIRPILDEHSFALRMPNNWKGDHMLEWEDYSGCKYEFHHAVLNYVDDCRPLAHELVELDDVAQKQVVDLDDASDEVQKAIKLCQAHPHIVNAFKFSDVKGPFINFTREKPSHCAVHDRQHDAADCFATISRGHVRLHCRREKVVEHGRTKSMYVGFIGKTELLELDTTKAKKRIREVKKIIKSNRAALAKKKVAAARAAKKAAREAEKALKAEAAAKTKEERRLAKEISDAAKEVAKAAKAEAKAVQKEQAANLSEEQVKELQEGFEEVKQKAIDFPEDKVWYYKDRREFVGVTLRTIRPAMDYVKQTCFKLEYSGEPIWATKNLYRGKEQIKLIRGMPFFASRDVAFKVINPDYDPGSPDSTPTLKRLMGDILVAYRKKHFHEAAEFMPWLKPEQKPNDPETLNLFDGFEHQYRQQEFKEEPAELQPILWHIRNILADRNVVVSEYIINWLAYTLQYSDRKAKVALLFKSDKEQAGKNVFFEQFAKYVMGERYYIMLTEMDQLTGGFNMHLRAKKLVLCNELANYAGYKASEKLKSIITDQDKVWTKKGVDSAAGKDYANLVFLTNNPHTVKIGLHCKRYVCCDISNEKVGDRPYFKRLVACFEEHGQLFFDYLTNLVLDDFDITSPPMTAFKQEMMWDNIPNAVKFMAALGSHELAEDFALDLDAEKPDQELKIKNKILYSIFKQWADREEPYDKTKPRQFTKDLERVLGLKKKTVRADTGRGEGYSFTYNGLLTAMRSALKRQDYTF